ncbi:MAG: hypothetical protein MMC23_003928 [Stictis urceolatum]|nr:hypothetical protein [Stictis urceolata]
MSAQAISKSCAENALEDLKKSSKPAQSSRNTPFEFLRSSASTLEVKRQWFNDPSNITRAAQKLGVNETSIAENRILREGPIRYLTTAIKPGYIDNPFPDAILVIVALSPLAPSNGLPRQGQPQSLEQGQDLSLSGDKTQTFDGTGGGIAYLLVFKKN